MDIRADGYNKHVSELYQARARLIESVERNPTLSDEQKKTHIQKIEKEYKIKIAIARFNLY